jgi:hypothetical protein
MVNRLFQQTAPSDGPNPDHPNRVRALAWSLLVVVVVLAGAATFYAARSEDAASGARDAAVEVRRVGLEQACRSEFVAAVTDAQTEVSTYADLLDSARLDVEIAGLIDQDDVALAAAVEEATRIRRLRDAAVEVRRLANDRYQEVIAAQREAPAKFRRLCAAGPPS